MTCIVGLVDGNDVWMGGDSAGWSEDHILMPLGNPKVFRVIARAPEEKQALQDLHFLIGYTSSYRMGQLLHYTLGDILGRELPLPTAGDDLFGYMATTFVTGVQYCLGRGGYQKEDNKQISGGTFLVGTRGRLFMIGDEYQVVESQAGYHACGSGRPLALGSLFTSGSIGWEPDKRILLALDAAAEFTGYVRGPHTIEVLHG
jgi:hypothetical protein